MHKSLFCFVSHRRSATVEQREKTAAATATSATAAAAAGLTQEEIASGPAPSAALPGLRENAAGDRVFVS